MSVSALGLVCASAAVYQTATADHAHAPTVQAVVQVTPQRAVTPQAAPSRSVEQLSRSQARPSASPAQAQQMARSMLAAYGWSQTQWPCLNKLWTQESSWMTTAKNPSSGAYGIPQSLPASKMATVGADYRTNTRTQLTWGLQYVKDAYGSPCQAWDFHLAHNWY